VPFSVLGALTFPDIFYSTGSIPTAVLGTIAALLLALWGKSLVTVAVGAILTAFFASFFL
jgi:branched-subunit amino acid transport protein